MSLTPQNDGPEKIVIDRSGPGRKPVHKYVQEMIKAYIVEHRLKPGDPIPNETELTRMLGVSRTAVREAVKSLEALSIVEVRAGSGLYVNRFSFDPIFAHLTYGILLDMKELNDLFEVRFYIEYGLIERAIEMVTPEQVAKLHEILDRLRQFAEANEYSIDDDYLFHSTLWGNVPNTVVGKVLDVFWMIFGGIRKHNEVTVDPHYVNVYHRHIDILSALENRDVQAMQDGIIAHFKDPDQQWQFRRYGPEFKHSDSPRDEHSSKE